MKHYRLLSTSEQITYKERLQKEKKKKEGR